MGVLAQGVMVRPSETDLPFRVTRIGEFAGMRAQKLPAFKKLPAFLVTQNNIFELFSTKKHTLSKMFFTGV